MINFENTIYFSVVNDLVMAVIAGTKSCIQNRHPIYPKWVRWSLEISVGESAVVVVADSTTTYN